jgi:colicin import membrane protein
MVVVSLICHLLVWFAAVKLNFSWRGAFIEEPVYYVDVVNLPAANPQAGSPAPAGTETGTISPLTQTPQTVHPPPQPSARNIPNRTHATQTIPGKGSSGGESAKEFEERISRIQKETEARHQAAALEALRKKGVAGSGKGRAGAPNASGTDAGSDYANYIQSRLRDSFANTITYMTKNPEVLVHLKISKSGRLIRYRLEKSTGDKVFEDAVILAITKAEKGFPPPPNGEEFEHGFVFRPQGVGKH